MREKICLSAFRLIAANGWNHLNLDRLAKATRLPNARIKAQFPNTYALLPALVEQITHETTATIGAFDKNSTPHDRLFEVMMARFDSLQKHRQEILNIMKASRSDPRIALHLLTAQRQAMHDMFVLAKYAPENPSALVASTGLLGIYIAASFAWSHDQTIDMSRTMSLLDRLLRHMGKCTEIISRFI